MSATVYLHVGIAKTGTTYLQRRLFANRSQLRREGLLYPGAGPSAHFHASLDLRGTTFKGYTYDGMEGAWDRLAAAANAFTGSTLISHETLARAKPAHIERAVSSFATDDVRVVVTVRDLGRQIPATWQETLKNRSETPYGDYLDDIFASWTSARRAGAGFWAAQDIEAVVRRWSAGVGAARLTVVTVPPSGAPPDELWRRFSQAMALPDLEYVEGEATSNSSLGVAEAELLRRLNPFLVDSLDWPQYESLVKRRLAERVLGPLDTQGRLSLPVDRQGKVEEIADAHIAFLRESGVTVVGDLADLTPRPAPPDARQPDTLGDAEVLAAALPALATFVATPSGRSADASPPGETPGARLRSLVGVAERWRLSRPLARAGQRMRHPRAALPGLRRRGR